MTGHLNTAYDIGRIVATAAAPLAAMALTYYLNINIRVTSLIVLEQTAMVKSFPARSFPIDILGRPTTKPIY